MNPGERAIERLGRRALRIPRAAAGAASAAAIVAAGRAIAGVRDVVVTDAWVAFHFDGDAPSALPPLDLARTLPAPKVQELAVRYDGEDLAVIADRLATTPRAVAALHASVEYEVAFLGFLPGFAYLRGLDPRLVVPRRDTPRVRVPPGAVAIGGPYTGIYPCASPGGWHLLGTNVGVPIWDSEGPLLAPGDRVRFREVG